VGILFLVVFLPANKNNLFVYTQILWITLCVNCYIALLPPVFNTFLLDCTKNRRSIIPILVAIIYDISRNFYALNKSRAKSLICSVYP